MLSCLKLADLQASVDRHRWVFHPIRDGEMVLAVFLAGNLGHDTEILYTFINLKGHQLIFPSHLHQQFWKLWPTGSLMHNKCKVAQLWLKDAENENHIHCHFLKKFTFLNVVAVQFIIIQSKSPCFCFSVSMTTSHFGPLWFSSYHIETSLPSANDREKMTKEQPRNLL